MATDKKCKVNRSHHNIHSTKREGDDVILITNDACLLLTWNDYDLKFLYLHRQSLVP